MARLLPGAEDPAVDLKAKAMGILGLSPKGEFTISIAIPECLPGPAFVRATAVYFYPEPSRFPAGHFKFDGKEGGRIYSGFNRLHG